MIKKIFKYLLGFFVFLYLVATAVLYANQERLIFRPHDLDEDHSYREGEEIRIQVDEAVSLSAVHIKKSNAKGIVLYLHGNKGNNRRCLRQAHQFDVDGYDLLMPDYRGFGKSGGRIESEAQLYADVQKVFDYIRDSLGHTNIVITAYSLGTGMATYLAAHNDCGPIFLIAPYLSLTDIKNRRFIPVPDFLVKYPLNTEKHMKSVSEQVVLFHSPDDQVIPFESSLELKQKFPGVELNTLAPVSHRSTIFQDEIRDRFIQVLADYNFE